MLSLTVSRNSGQPLADQIVAGIKRANRRSAPTAGHQAAIDP